MSVVKLLILNTFLALQSRGANIDWIITDYVTKTTFATNNRGDCSQPFTTLWEATPSSSNHTNALHDLNDYLSHELRSRSYSSQYIMLNIGIASCSDASIVCNDCSVMTVTSYENEVHLLPTEFKDIQPNRSDLVSVSASASTRDKTEASFFMAQCRNTMHCIISVCRNNRISNAQCHSENRISLRIANRHIKIAKEQSMHNILDINILYVASVVALMLMFIMCKCPKCLSFNAVILMTVSSVFGQESCDAAYECVGQSRPINRADTLWSRGYKANSGGTTDITVDWGSDKKEMLCGAAFSCANIGYIKGSATQGDSDLYCDGVFGCLNASVNLTGNIDRRCDGSNGCYGVTFHSHRGAAGISCSGDRSCTNAELYNHNTVHALGSYALYNATIHSTADGLDVYLVGSNAGFGAKIFCVIGHSCTIYCYATGCNMLYIDCVGNCNIQSNSIDTVLLTITNYSLFDESQMNILYDSSALAKSNDAACLLGVDDYRGNTNAFINGSNVCCRGMFSCDMSTIQSTTSVVCNGRYSCHSNITANDAIFCSASWGCFGPNNSTLYSLNDVYCLGTNACYLATITARNVYCSGSNSCTYSTILNTGTIYFSGYYSGNGAVINCAGTFCNIICDGYLSCRDIASIHCNECTVVCDRDTGCPPGYTYTPTYAPTYAPTLSTLAPTYLPTMDPTPSPTSHPTDFPTLHPTIQTNPPTLNPISPSLHPTIASAVPTSQTTNPTIVTNTPTLNTTISSTLHPTIQTNSPTLYSTMSSSLHPAVTTNSPTLQTADTPTFSPTFNPTRNPIQSSTKNPSKSPTDNPTLNPTLEPTPSATNDPTLNPTLPPTSSPTTPTHAPTHEPTINPTGKPTSVPTKRPTRHPTISPTYLTINPTNVPTKNTTRSPTNTPTGLPIRAPTSSPSHHQIESQERSEWLTMERVLTFTSLLLVLVLLVVIFKYVCMPKVKKTNQKRDENVISNALVALIVIGEYDDAIADCDADLAQPLSSLPLETDVRNLTALFGMHTFNYNIIQPNDGTKLHWKADEVVSFLQNDVGKELFDGKDELTYDGLIVVISSHGIKDNIITSDYRTIEKVALHRIISIKYPKSREIPRLFLFDSCEGSGERIQEEYKIEIVEEKDQIKGFGLNDVQGGDEWTTNTKNPDYKLVEIHAANAGFQAKAHTQLGSYLIHLFTLKMKSNIERNQNKTLSALFDEIQNELHDAGKSQTKNVFNNTTANLIFIKRSEEKQCCCCYYRQEEREQEAERKEVVEVSERNENVDQEMELVPISGDYK